MGKQFRNDYSELAHPYILEALCKYQNEQNIAYGLDYHSANAAKYIKDIFGAQNSDVHFISGGTQTNLLLISYALKHFEGVICANTGHINVHEAAAIEGAGYKIITLPNIDGKINASQVNELIKLYDDEHMVKPKMVYISNSTETGTIYTRQELIDLYETCKENDLYFYIDGARLGSALTSKDNDIDPSSLGSLCDAFYIGGTKNGLLFGEALVLNNPDLKKDFRRHIKNKGAMLAKGYAVGIQFEAAFENGLYFDLSKKTNEIADIFKENMKKMNIEMFDSPTNQVFISLPKDEANLYIEQFGCEKWIDNRESIVIRFVFSFLSTKEDVNNLCEYMKPHHK